MDKKPEDTLKNYLHSILLRGRTATGPALVLQSLATQKAVIQSVSGIQTFISEPLKDTHRDKDRN